MKQPITDSQATLFHLIKNRSLTSIELRQLTKSSFPAARIFDLIDKHKVSIIKTSEKYVNRNKQVSHITRYTLALPIKEAVKIYNRIAA